MVKQFGLAKLAVMPAQGLSASILTHTSMPPVSDQTMKNGNYSLEDVGSDRDVIRCITCGMVQYRTCNGNCRRCLHLLTPKRQFLVPPPAMQELPGDDRQPFEKWPNCETVENIGQRIRQLRESRGITQSQLQLRSHVSVVLVPDRKRTNDTQPRNAGKTFRSAWRRSEPLLCTGNERRNSLGRSIHSDVAAVPAAARLGAVAIDSEALSRDK